jgi:hypothetical protein
MNLLCLLLIAQNCKGFLRFSIIHNIIKTSCRFIHHKKYVYGNWVQESTAQMGSKLSHDFCDIKTISVQIGNSSILHMLEQPCSESSINFAARVFDRESSHLQLSAISAYRR